MRDFLTSVTRETLVLCTFIILWHHILESAVFAQQTFHPHSPPKSNPITPLPHFCGKSTNTSHIHLAEKSSPFLPRQYHNFLWPIHHLLYWFCSEQKTLCFIGQEFLGITFGCSLPFSIWLDFFFCFLPSVLTSSTTFESFARMEVHGW